MMMDIFDLNFPCKKLLLASMVSLLVACGSDNDDPVQPPVENTPPVANPTEGATTLGNSVLIDALANDTDADGDSLVITDVKVKEGTGQATISDNQILFEPAEVGTTIIEYSIEDGNGGSAQSIITIIVSENNLVYVGSNKCVSCHIDKKSFFETGHNFKFTKIENGEEPIYPFTSISGILDFIEGVDNTLGKPTGWGDISYVIGGYKSSAMFVDMNGYIFSGDKVGGAVVPKGHQVTAEMMYAYAPNDAPDAHPYDYCGRCHTTGWKDYTEATGDYRNLNRQDDMPGMGGTFALTGVQCESCHGAGGEHIQEPSKQNIVKRATARTTEDYLRDDMGYGKAVACSECHTVDDSIKRYPDYISPQNAVFGGDTQGGRIAKNGGGLNGRGGRHAATTMIGTDPDSGEAMGKKKDFTCSTCHNPHKSEHYQTQPGHENAIVRECTDCHSKKFNPGNGGGVAHATIAKCTDCHMPSESHMFKIDISRASDDASNFSLDGKYNKPWLRASDSCKTCHEQDYDERAIAIGNIH
ncbi:Ig-like domain-containing protein [Shewanella sp. Isolate13]|uniref:Ig-like domain-containing protein n=1 Tax=Shewanella sp. Isolate13 TaxID=2908531 RepID=UPI001EFCF668|nr:Ig-like domain-containing protein [Shewanella sp. Isolate13]MCG9729532.1 Ig-like domain-containing protein [Shewanella sp. Isolate13]